MYSAHWGLGLGQGPESWDLHVYGGAENTQWGRELACR